MSVYPRLVAIVTAKHGAIGPYPSLQYAVSQLLYHTVNDVDALLPPPPVQVIQEEKNRQISGALSQIAGQLAYAGARSSALIQEDLSDVGKWISENVLLPNCLCCWQGSLPHTVEIITDQHEIPWELTWVNGDFLARQTIHARYPLVSKTRHTPVSYGSPPKMAIIKGSSEGLHLVESEIDGICQAYFSKYGQNAKIFDGEAVKVEFIRRLLSGLDSDLCFDIIHFIGHGNAQNDDVWLELLGSPFLKSNIPEVLNRTPIVFWNSCLGAASISNGYRYQSDVVDAFGSELLSNGASHFIGPLFPVLDGTARDFAVDFYAKLFEGETIGKAFFDAKNKLVANDPIALTYVLYGNPALRTANE